MDLLAQIQPDEIASQWFKWVSLIMLIGAVAILLVVMVGVARRWKRRQLNAIESDRVQRRAGKSAERVDAWQASSERYIDRDKLSEDDLFKRDEEEDDDSDDAPPSDDGYTDTPEEDRDPFGLFDDKPFQEADDDDDDDLDDDEDWDADDEDEEGHGR